MHGLEQEYAGRIRFVYLDIDDPANSAAKKALGYRVQPHLFLLDPEGNILAEWQGPVRREDLVAAFEEALQP